MWPHWVELLKRDQREFTFCAFSTHLRQGRICKSFASQRNLWLMKSLPDVPDAPSSGLRARLRLSPWLGWVLVALLVLTSLVWVVWDWQFAPTAVSQPIHRIAQTSGEFRLLGTWMQAPPARPPVVGTGRLVMARDGKEPALQALDISTGALVWQHDPDERTRPRNWPEWLGWSALFSYRWSGLVSHGGRVYVTEAYGLRTTVVAYDLQTGERVWQHKLGLVNGSDASYMAIAGEQVVVRINAGDFNEFYALNMENGRQEVRQRQEAYPVFLLEKEPPRLYEVVATGVRMSQTGFWQQEFNSCGIMPQVYQEALLLWLQECQEPLGRVLALNRYTGDLLWQLDAPALSNVALNDAGIAFVLTTDGLLRAVQVRTGHAAGFVQFGAPLTPMETAVYYVAAQDDVAAVYTGDSSQMFTFRYVPMVP